MDALTSKLEINMKNRYYESTFFTGPYDSNSLLSFDSDVSKFYEEIEGSLSEYFDKMIIQGNTKEPQQDKSRTYDSSYEQGFEGIPGRCTFLRSPLVKQTIKFNTIYWLSEIDFKSMSIQLSYM